MRYENKTAGRRGFTLVELIIVITILLSFSLVLVIQRNQQAILLENTANEMVSALRYARMRYDAGDGMACFRIQLVDGQHHIRVFERSRDTARESIAVDIPVDPSIRILSKVRGEYEEEETVHSLTDLGSMVTSTLEVRFSGQSAIRGSGDHSCYTFVLQGKSEPYYYKITIVPTSSRIHLYKLKSE